MRKTLFRLLLYFLISLFFFSFVSNCVLASFDTFSESELFDGDEEIRESFPHQECSESNNSNLLVESVPNDGTIPDGIYAFKNLGNTNRWMDVQYNQTNPGYHMQQYAFGISPSIVYSASGLYKITRVGNTQRYIIRLVLNNNLSFGISTGTTDILTKTIPSNDSDVGFSDTFYITYDNGGYTIKPASSTLYVCANLTQNSGSSGAPLSYLTAKTLSSAGNNARWIVEGYHTQIPNGIYAFENIGNSGLWMDVRQNQTSPGYPMQQYAFSQSPAETFSRSGLFKVTQNSQAGLYTIRLMLNNRLSFGSVSNDVLTKIIPVSENAIFFNELFYIVFYNGGYAIRPENDNDYYISAKNSTASGSYGGNNSKLTTRTMTDAGSRALWKMYQYTGTAQTGYNKSYSSSVSDGIQILNTVHIDYVFWSTVIGTNDAQISCAPNDSFLLDWYYDRSQQRLTLTPKEPNIITVTTSFNINGVLQSYYDYYNSIFLQEMTNFFFQNMEYYNYVEDDSGTPKHNIFNGETSQKWIFTHVGDGYYKIISSVNGKAITVPSGNEGTDNVNLTLENYIGTNNQKWKISTTSNHNYKIKAKSSENYSNDLVLAVETSNIFNPNNTGLKIRQRKFINDTNLKDEWHIYCLDGSGTYLYATKNYIGIDRISEYSMILNYLFDLEERFFNYENPDYISSGDFINNIAASHMFILRGMGGYNNNTTFLNLHETGSSSKLYGTDIYNNQTPGLSITYLAVFASSYSAKNISGGIDLVSAMKSVGAIRAIGFNSSVTDDNINLWTKKLFYFYTVENDIDLAFYDANNYMPSMSGISVMQ